MRERPCGSRAREKNSPVRSAGAPGELVRAQSVTTALIGADRTPGAHDDGFRARADSDARTRASKADMPLRVVEGLARWRFIAWHD